VSTDFQGPVTIEVTFNPQEQTKRGELVFKVKMDAHAIKLGEIDLDRLSALRDE
jgi:hypothetical protein